MSHRWTAQILLYSAIWVLTTGCEEDTPAEDDDTDPELSPCDEGLRQDADLPEEFLDDFPDGCVPQACGIGRWGNLEIDRDTVYVDANAAEDGDGSEDAPFTSIQGGLDAAADKGTGVIVAAGTYFENLFLNENHDGARLAGRCQELVVVDGSGGDGGESGIRADGLGGDEEWWVSGLTVTGAPSGGLWLDVGKLSLDGSLLVGNRRYGAFAQAASSKMLLSNATVADTQPGVNGAWGRGINVQEGASLQAEGCLVEGNTDVGIFAASTGTSIHLSNVEVRETRPMADGTKGRGIEVQEGASLQAEDCLVEGNAEAGVFAASAGTLMHLSNVEVRETRPADDGTTGRGINVQEGASLQAEGCVVEGNTEAGIFAGSEGTTVHLSNVEVRETKPLTDGTGGRGINVQEGASLQAEGCLVEGNTEVGIFAASTGTSIHLSNVEVRETRSMADGTKGRGIEVQEGASLDAEDCLVEGNTDAGVFVSTESTGFLSNVVVRDTQPMADGNWGKGIQVQEGASLQAEGCLVEGNTTTGIGAESAGTRVYLSNVVVRETRPIADGVYGWGISVDLGAALWAEDCLVEGNTEVGILSCHGGTTVHLSNVEVLETRRPAIYSVAAGMVSQHGAFLSASDVVVSQTQGPGIFATQGGDLSCTGCELLDNAYAGAGLWAGGTIALLDTTIAGTVPDANEGGGVGINASDRFRVGTLLIENTIIEDQPYSAIWLDGSGSFTIRDSTLVGGYGMEFEYPDGTTTMQHGDAVVVTGGVTAWDGANGLLLEGNEIQNAVRTGVLLDGSSAMLTNNSFTGNSTDLIWQDCDGVDEPVGLNDVPAVEYCPGYNHHIAPLEFNLILEEIEPLE